MSTAEAPTLNRTHNIKTLRFMVILSVACALILAILASVLEKPKEVAKELDRSKQMMIAARILNHEGHFQIKNEKEEYVEAKYVDGQLIAGQSDRPATKEQLLDILDKQFKPLLVDNEGNLHTFQESGIDLKSYIAEFRKRGYYTQSYKLIYKIEPNEGFIIPVNGFGLWDAIYGYLAIKMDGNTVTGITWYDQKETPGLGANIAEAHWQQNFHEKKLFQANSSGQTNFKLAPLGITVVKGKVSEVLGTSPKAQSAVDGMAGATLTGNGVTSAYQTVLEPYRPFLIKLANQYQKDKNG